MFFVVIAQVSTGMLSIFLYHYNFLILQALLDDIAGIPIDSLSNEDRLRECLIQLDEKEEEIKALYGRISKLEADKKDMKKQLKDYSGENNDLKQSNQTLQSHYDKVMIKLQQTTLECEKQKEFIAEINQKIEVRAKFLLYLS